MASLQAARTALDQFLADSPGIARIEQVAQVMASCVRAGGKILACGNGGSACDAMHFCEELTGRFRTDRPPIPAIACADPGHITCVANDYGFEQVFERWTRALGRRGDVVVLLSTSGSSGNIVRAASAAKELGLTRVSLLGRGGGDLRGRCEHEWIVPGETSDRIQELHMLILHTIVERLEAMLAAC